MKSGRKTCKRKGITANATSSTMRLSRPRRCSQCGKLFIDLVPYWKDKDVLQYLHAIGHRDVTALRHTQFQLCPSCTREIQMYARGNVRLTTYAR